MQIVTDLLGHTVEVGNFRYTADRPERFVEYVGIVRGASVEKNYVQLLVELVELTGTRVDAIGDLVTTWIGDSRFVRPVERCAKCHGWGPHADLTPYIEPILCVGRWAHTAGKGCQK